MNSNSTMPLGYSDVPPGHVASVVTCLQMFDRPAAKDAPLPPGVTVDRWERPDIEGYRALFRRVGSDWLWTSRILMSDEDLSPILNDSAVEVFVVRADGENVGLLELDFREPGECELAFLGLGPGATGKGFGRAVINMAIGLAWSRPIRRFWVHTCTFDHPAALGFYIRSGFKPYAFQVEVLPDPRLSGHLPPEAGSHVPLISPAE